MKLLWLSALLAVAALPVSTAVDAKPGAVSQYTKLTRCSQVAAGDVERGEDWVYMRCKGLGRIPAWYLCQDSSHCKLGFGTKPNGSGFFEATSFLSWPIEWRGTFQQGRFKPVAVIVRGRWLGLEQTDPTTLVVYRLRLDGTSCMVGEASTNAAARRIADKAANDYQCSDDPELL